MADDVPGIDIEDLPLEDRRKLPYNHPLLDDLAERVSARIGIPGMVTALKNAGEKSQSGSVSPKGAQGVMQFMPETGKRYGLTDPTDPVASINAAGDYVADIAKKLGTKDPALIAAAYNAGEHRRDIQQGRIPLIPETQKYVTRVKGYFASRDGQTEGVDPADLPTTSGGIDPADLPNGSVTTQEDVTRKYASPKGPQVNSTSRDASPVRLIWNPIGDNFQIRIPQGAANFLAGVDRGVTDPIIGAGQRLRELANHASRKIIDKDLFDLSDSYRDAKIRNDYDAPLLSSGAGMAGYMTGSGIDTALAATLTGGTAAPTLMRSAATGAGSGYLMPAASEREAVTNAGTGAVLGPAAYGVGKGLSKLADTAPVRGALSTVKEALGRVNIPKVLQPSLRNSLSEPARDAIDEAMKQGVPVWKKQITKPGYTLPEDLAEKQASAFDRAIARTVGENTDDLNAAWQAAHANLSKRYDKLLGNKQIPLDFQHLGEVGDLISKNAAREPRFQANPQVQQALERAFQAAENGTPMSGRDYQQALREYSGLATKLFKGTPENPSDPYSARLILGLMDSLENQASQVLSKKEMAEFQALNKMWRNKSQLESLVPKDLNGSVDPRALARKLGSVRKDELLYGQGDQTLPNLAKFGSTYMNPPPPKGFLGKLGAGAKTAAPFIGAGILEGEISGGVQAGETPVEIAERLGRVGITGYAGRLALNALMKQRAGQQLTPAEMNALRGALPLLAKSAVRPGALTRSYLAERGVGQPEEQ